MSMSTFSASERRFKGQVAEPAPVLLRHMRGIEMYLSKPCSHARVLLAVCHLAYIPTASSS
jgi:hypothetical protein